MPTPRYAYRFPVAGDAPNVPLDFERLATDVESWTSRGFPCTSSTRPTGVSDGFIIRETDTGNWLGWTGSAWVALGGGGGGSSYVGVGGQWSATSAQSIPFNVNTVVAFPVANLTSPLVTRTTNGPGHTFTLSENGTYAIDGTTRFLAGDAGGNRYLELRNASNSVRYAAEGNDGGPGAVTLAFSIVRKLIAGTALTVIAAQTQSGGGSLLLDPTSGGSPTTGWVQLSITKIAG